MPSNKLTSADNQQESLITIGWIVGYIDGEGCFCVSVIKNNTTKSGYQIFPEFVVTQGAKSLSTLELIKKYFQCGSIWVNRRHDNHKENIYRYCVRSRKDLVERIIPFFEKYSLKSAKRDDFEKFNKVIQLMNNNQHLNKNGLKKVIKIAESMNRKVKRY